MAPRWLRDKRKKDYECHLERLQNIKPSIDNKPPTTHMAGYGKREIEMRLRQERIDRENQRVVDRLATAMHTKHIDNENKDRERILQIHRTQNDIAKKVRLQKIQLDNRRVLDNIIRAQPMYDHLKWEEEAERHEVVLKNMTEFPELFEKVRRAISPKRRRPATAMPLPLSKPSNTGPVESLNLMGGRVRPKSARVGSRTNADNTDFSGSKTTR